MRLIEFVGTSYVHILDPRRDHRALCHMGLSGTRMKIQAEYALAELDPDKDICKQCLSKNRHLMKGTDAKKWRGRIPPTWAPEKVYKRPA